MNQFGLELGIFEEFCEVSSLLAPPKLRNRLKPFPVKINEINRLRYINKISTQSSYIDVVHELKEKCQQQTPL